MKYLCVILLMGFCEGTAIAQYNSIGYDSAALRHKTVRAEVNFENNKWSEGFIVLSRGDTMHGQIKTGGDFYDATERQWQVEFQSNKISHAQYDPTQLRGYTYVYGGGYKVFHSMANSLPTIGGLYHDEEQIFLEVVSLGKCKVYTFGQSSKRGEKLKTKKGGLSPRPYCLSIEGRDLQLVNQQKFKKTIMLYFNNCPALVDKVKHKIFTFQNWKDMVADYNNECR